MRKTLVVAIAGALAAGAMVGGATIALAQADVIKERQALMKANGGAAKQAVELFSGAKPYDAAAAAAAAEAIATDMEKFPTLFPEGSDQGETTASPAIWQKMDDFKALAAKTVTDSRAAAAAAPQGADAFKAAFAAVGGDCQSCHEQFRVKKN